MAPAYINVFELLDERGGLKIGHTEFRDGCHGDGWTEKGAVFARPGVLDDLA